MPGAHEDVTSPIEAWEPYFGVRRQLECPPLERVAIKAGDGATLLLHRSQGGARGPVLLAPGTGMSGLSYALDTIPRNLVEFLTTEGFDVWLLDWRTSPLLPAHSDPYTMDDVARLDWPAAVNAVQERAGTQQVSILAHCLSSPALLLALLRGYVPRDAIRSIVASQVALHLRLSRVGTIKVRARIDSLLPGRDMIHQKPSETARHRSDLAVSLLGAVLSLSQRCGNGACARHRATFGELLLHSRVGPLTPQRTRWWGTSFRSARARS